MHKLLITFILLNSLNIYAQEKGVKPIENNKETPLQNTYAVVVGISDYQDPGIPDLRFADKDAEAFAGFLRSNAGGKLDNDHLKVLINQEATMAQFANALDWLWEVCKEGDQAIIYFSGHGDVEKKSLTQPGFLLCWDAPARVYMAGGAFALPMLQEVVSTLSIQNKAKVIVITDACRSGTLAGSSVGGSQATAANLAKQFANEIKIMSCQPNEYSIEGEQWGGGRGAFSYHLLDALYGMADSNHDLWVTLQEAGRYLEDHVSGEVAPVSQVPMVVGNRNERLSGVDEQLLASIKSGKTIQTAMLSAVESRGIEEDVLSKLDTGIKMTYLLFKSSLKDKIFLEPVGACANTYFEQLINEPKLERLHSTMKRNYAAALQDDAQQVINIWLKADVKQLNCIGRRIPLEPIPGHLKKAAELLGTTHYMYTYLKARQLLFEGITNVKHNNPDAVMGNQILEKFKQALMLEPNSPVIWHQMSRVYVNNLRNYDSAYTCALQAISLSPQWILPLTDLCFSSFQNEKLNFSEEVFKMADSIAPQHPLVIQVSATLKARKGDYDGAVAELQAYRDAKGPLYPCWFNDLAGMLSFAGRNEEAESAFKEALAMDSTEAAILNNLGGFYNQLGRIDDAEKYLLKGIELDSNNVFSWYNLGNLYLQKSEFLQAEKCYKNGIARDSNEIYNLNSLANLYIRFFDSTKFKEAEYLIAKVLELNSSYPAAWISKGNLYFATNRPEDGIKAYLKGLELDPKSYETVQVLAFMYSSMGKDSLGLELVNNFLEHNSDPNAEISLLSYVGFNYLKNLNFTKGAETFEKLVAYDSTNITVLNNLAYSYLNLGRMNESEKIFKLILSRDSTHAPSWGNLGEIYLKTNRYELAEKYLEKSRSINPNWVYSWTNFGALYLKTNQYEKAEKHLKKAIEIDSIFALPFIYLARVCIKTDRPDEAIVHFKNVIRINPNAFEAHLGLAGILAQKGKTKEANDLVLQAIQNGASYTSLMEEENLTILQSTAEWKTIIDTYFSERKK